MTEPIFLLPGEMAYQREPTTITTLLGSCVAVCLHDRRRGWGGMNHFMVPDPSAGSQLTPGKIGVSAIAQLLRLAEMAGSARSDLTAQLYGGGAVIGLVSAQAAGVGDVGARNIDLAQRAMREAGITVAAHDTGGMQGRRISMDSATGVVQVMLIPPSAERAEQHARAERLRNRKVGVLVIDDSATVRRILRQVIDASGDLEVIAEAEHPFQARERILEREPDVLCLDLIMPQLDGLSFLRRIMQFKPIPTVVVSTIAKAGSTMHANVMAAGAVAAIDKDALDLYRSPDAANRVLLPALRQAARAAVGKR